jgi:hypothetical protein
MGDDYSKCENTGDAAREVSNQATCQQRASTAGASFYSFQQDNRRCYYSMSCDASVSTSALWKRYKFGNEEYEQNCPAASGLTVWSESRFYGNAAANADGCVNSVNNCDDGCVNDATWETAVSVCADTDGARLCTQEEMAAGCTTGTGCGHDSDMIWTATSYPVDCHFVACGDTKNAACVPETCEDNSALHEVRSVLPLRLPSAPPSLTLSPSLTPLSPSLTTRHFPMHRYGAVRTQKLPTTSKTAEMGSPCGPDRGSSATRQQTTMAASTM